MQKVTVFELAPPLCLCCGKCFGNLSIVQPSQQNAKSMHKEFIAWWLRSEGIKNILQSDAAFWKRSNVWKGLTVRGALQSIDFHHIYIIFNHKNIILFFFKSGQCLCFWSCLLADILLISVLANICGSENIVSEQPYSQPSVSMSGNQVRMCRPL